MKAEEGGLKINEIVENLPSPIKLKNVSLFYEKIEESMNKAFGTVEIKHLHRIYSASIGKGHRNIIIITDPDAELREGQDIILKPMEKDRIIEIVDSDTKLLNYFNKVWEKSLYELLDDYEYYGKIFYEPLVHIPDDLMEKIIRSGGFIKRLTDDVLPEGLLDDRIHFLMKSRLLNFSNKVVKRYQKYQGHAIAITNTKVGKSTASRMLLGEKNVYDAASCAGLLGFSSAESTNIGDIHCKVAPTILDEITSKSYNNIFDQIASAMENGYCRIGKGRETVSAETMTSFTYFTNQRGRDAGARQMMSNFEDFLNKFTSSAQRVGSRFGLILFGNDFREPEGDHNYSQRKISFLRMICNRISGAVEKIMEDERIVEILNSRIMNYSKRVNYLLDNVHMQAVRDFWDANKVAHRHINGFALLLSAYEYTEKNQTWIVDINKFDFEEFRDIFYDIRKTILEWNLSSLEKISTASVSKSEYLAMKLDNAQRYVKFLALTVREYMKHRGRNNDRKLIVVEELDKYYKDATEKIPGEKLGRYVSLSKVLEKINLDRIDDINRLFSAFGFQMKTIKLSNIDNMCVEIEDDSLLSIGVEEDGSIGSEGSDSDPDDPSDPESSGEGTIFTFTEKREIRDRMLDIIPDSDLMDMDEHFKECIKKLDMDKETYEKAMSLLKADARITESRKGKIMKL